MASDVDTSTYIELGDWFASQYFIPTDNGRREERWAICLADPLTGDLAAVTWRSSKAAAIAYIDSQRCSR